MLNVHIQFIILGWKVSVEQQISDLHLNRSKLSTENVSAVYESIRSTALSIYEQYLGEKSEQKIQLKQSLVQELHFKIRNLNETPSELWFDRIMEAMFDKMETEFLPPFKKSKAYIKLLQELDLVQQTAAEEDTISLNSTDSLENETAKLSDNLVQIGRKGDLLAVNNAQKSVKHARSFSDVTMFTGKNDVESKSRSSSQESKKIRSIAANLEIEEEVIKTVEQSLKTGQYILSVNIIETGSIHNSFLNKIAITSYSLF